MLLSESKLRFFTLRTGREVILNGRSYRAHYADGLGWPPGVWRDLLAASMAYEHEHDEDAFATAALHALLPNVPVEAIDCLPLATVRAALIELGFYRDDDE